MQLIPTILCGGAGSRLWPVSRELHPKPFIRLQDGQSLLQKTFLRAAALPGVAEILTVTNRALFFQTEDQYAEVNAQGVPLAYMLEPFGRNTAAAVMAAALRVRHAYGDEALLLVLAADHLISDAQAFGQAVEQAAALAREGKLVTFGIQPTAPETGYGYIEAQGNSVLRFVEKPGREQAEEYFSSGRYVWNSGMFCFTAAGILQELRCHAPEVYARMEECFAHARTASGEQFAQTELEAEYFMPVPDISLDYAVMEKSSNVAVVRCDIGWSDIGSWTALGDLAAADSAGNRVQGEAMLHGVSNCYIHASERVVGAVGVENLIIIDTPDALLVAGRDAAQEVKHLYGKLKAQGHAAQKQHRTVHRPWGTYTVLEQGEGFKIKRIVVKPGASLSLQMHKHRSEHWVVVSGVARVEHDGREFLLRANESTYIPAGNKHRLANASDAPAVIIEVQSGGYLEEDDIVRFDDAYGRVAR